MTYPWAPRPDLGPAPNTDEIAQIADLLRAGAKSGATANALARLWNYNVDPAAINAALKLTDHDFVAHRGTRHEPRLRGRGPAARNVQRGEVMYRAAYVANASRRINDDLAAGRTMKKALAHERRYYAMHELARRNRQRGALAVDGAAEAYGQLLGWHAHEDDRTTPECRAADGHNFRAGRQPAIGYPGTVHMYCRCSPGPPFARGKDVDVVTEGIHH